MSAKNIQEELKHLLSLLLKEKEEDLRQYRMKIAGTSLKERRQQGVCWYPVYLQRINFDAGERLYVRVSRSTEHRDSHMFRSGKPVSLFSNAGDNHENREVAHGVVNNVSEHEMTITLNSSAIPSWIEDGYLGVQLLFDENSYREMEGTLKTLIKTKDERLQQLKNILLGNEEARFENNPPVTVGSLNRSQNEALNLILNARDVAIVHGPPGTGKTTTLVQSALQLLHEEQQILVCAPSNAAVDLLVEKLDEQGVDVVRIGHPARVTEDMLQHTLDARIARHEDFRELKKLKIRAEEFRTLGKKYKRHFGRAEREQRKLLLHEADVLRDAADQLEFYITNSILSQARVIATTLVGANHSSIKGMQFRTVIIDEAAQALEPAAWIPILRAERVIFAGDHFQLPPTIKSLEAAKEGLNVTLFEKAIQRNRADVMLREQYRMNVQIMNFPAGYFYKNQLKANGSVANWQVLDHEAPIEFIDTAGTGFSEQVNPETKSSYNVREAEILQKHFRAYLERIEKDGKEHNVSGIGIITPYSAQAGVLEEMFDTEAFHEKWAKKITVNTIDSFQGQERDIVYISLVRSNEKGEIGFLSNIRRMNVAMTRARKKLVMIGDSATVCRHPFYDRVLDYIHEHGAYRSAFEWISGV